MEIIRNMGIEEWEPKVIQQMLEYSYKYNSINKRSKGCDCEIIRRYVTDLVCDAKLLSQHARKRTIDAEDARLSALQMAEKHVSAPPATYHRPMNASRSMGRLIASSGRFNLGMGGQPRGA